MLIILFRPRALIIGIVILKIECVYRIMGKRFCGNMITMPPPSSMKQILSIIIWAFKVNNKTLISLTLADGVILVCHTRIIDLGAGASFMIPTQRFPIV